MSSTASIPDIPAQRLQDLNSLSMVYGGRSEEILNFLLQAEKPQNHSLGIEPVVFTRGKSLSHELKSDEKNFFMTQLEEACRNKDAYLVLTPEFSLYTVPIESKALSFDEKGGIVEGQQSVVDAIDQATLLAKEYKKTIVLSSFCERKRLKNGKSAFFNTTLIVLPSGERIFRRKISEIYLEGNQQIDDISSSVLSNGPNSSVTNDTLKEVLDLTLNTLKPITILDNQNNSHTIQVVVCREYAFNQIKERLSPNIDMIIVPMSDGSLSLNNDASAVTAYMESLTIMKGIANKGKVIKIAITNERSKKASVIEFDGETKIAGILLK